MPTFVGFFYGIRMNNLDPVNVAVAVASVLFGPTLAAIIGPYAVIVIASTVGAAWSLGRRDPTARLGAVWYFLRLNATAVLITAGLADIVGRWIGGDDTSWLLAPIALLVGGVGDDWPRIGRWIIARVGSVFERRIGGGPQ
ncbi:Holin [Bordetella tumbae]